MIPIVYHPSYNITAFGLEKRHPFDGRKYRRIHDALVARDLRRPGDFARPRPASRADLLRVHSAGYLRSLKSPETLARILELPIVRRLPGPFVDWRILRPMRFAAGGTALACRLALDRGLAINLGGGFHHASADRGGGFCVYADAAMAAEILREQGKVVAVFVVDLDAHQGNGTASIFRERPWAQILDLFGEDLFPAVKEPEDFPIPVPAGLAGPAYLDLIREALPNALDASRPDLVIYNAGSDVFEGDPLGRFRLTRSEVADRDLLVVDMVRERGIPLAMILSGGYSTESWRIHADAIEGIATRFDPTC